ncbi:MAG TPA: hypothetical protein VGM33_27170, partial [Baekduia sp.]
FNDGYWFAFYTEGHYAFMGMRMHPNNNVLDGYAGMVVGGEQRAVRFSRALRPRANELQVGPLRIEIVEPLKVQRVTLGPNEQGLEWDVHLTAETLWTEDRALQHRHGVVLNDVLRYTGVCRPAGWMSVDGARTEVDDWHAARDHSWGIRSSMGPRTPLGGVLDEARDPRAIRIWIPFRCGTQVGFVHGHEDVDGNVLDFAGEIRDGDRTITLASMRHAFEYVPGSRRLKAGTYTLVATDGTEYDYTFEVVCEGVHPQAFGYNQGWSDGASPGVWRGPEVVESSRHDVTDPNAKPFGAHLPRRRRLGATEFAARLHGPGGATGMAMVEHMVYGTYRPSGFEGTDHDADTTPDA